MYANHADHFWAGFLRAATATTSWGIESLDFLQPTIATFNMSVPSESVGAEHLCQIIKLHSLQEILLAVFSWVMIPHIEGIIASSLRCRRYIPDNSLFAYTFVYILISRNINIPCFGCPIFTCIVHLIEIWPLVYEISHYNLTHVTHVYINIHVHILHLTEIWAKR